MHAEIYTIATGFCYFYYYEGSKVWVDKQDDFTEFYRDKITVVHYLNSLIEEDQRKDLKDFEKEYIEIYDNKYHRYASVNGDYEYCFYKYAYLMEYTLDESF